MSNKLISSIFAYSAGGLAAICSFPQLYQIIKTKKVRDLNPYFFILHSISDFLYFGYGLIENDYVLAISVSMPAICNLIIFVLWLFYADENNNIDLNTDNNTNNDLKIDAS